MSNKPQTDDGGPAFPWHQSPGNQNNLGMSLRDWFAGQALTGLLAMCAGEHINAGDQDAAAKVAYLHADAMLAARKEPTGDVPARCEPCDGTGALTYNPNLNPDSFPASASAKCPHRDGTGEVPAESVDRAAEQWAFEAFATAHPHEAYAESPDRFWEFFHTKHPGVSRERMEATLKETNDAGEEP